IDLRAPRIGYVSAVDARPHERPEEIRELLVLQLSSPVRWTDTLRALAARDLAQIIECGPGKVLTGLNRRIERRPNLSFLALDDPLMAELESAGELPTILVNNAAITRDQLLLRMKPEDWDAVITTNLTGVFRVSKACVRRMMKERHGRIVNLTSVVGVTGNAGQANYAAAKAGLLGFTRSLAKELASRGITVNAVAPGLIDTDMTRALGEEQRRALLEQVPMGRLGTPAEVAGAVLFLVSPQ